MGNRNLPAVKPGAAPVALDTIPIGKLGAEITNAGQLYAVCQQIANTDMVNERLRGKPSAIFGMAMLGMPLGFDIWTSIRRIEMQFGKPTLPAELMLAVILRAPDRGPHYIQAYEGKPYEDNFCAVLETQRKGGVIQRSTFSVADAKQAGLWTKDTWKKYPKAMLHARCVGVHARTYWADVMNGLQPSEDYEAPVEVRVEQARNVTPVRLELEVKEPTVDPLLVDVEPVVADVDGEIVEEDFDYEAALAELTTSLDQSATDLCGEGEMWEHTRGLLRDQVMAQAGVEKGVKPTLEQIGAMLRALPLLGKTDE